MSLANVNIGAAANDGTGDPLRSAFRTINQNFANLAPFASNANITYNAGVESVAGRTGNVVLTVADVVGAASIGYVDIVSANTASIAANIAGNLNTVIWANVTNKPSFANIATTGSWDDLTDIPANVSDAVTQTEIDTANDAMIANVTAANARIGQLQANINTLFSNAAVQHNEFGNLRANITAANAAIAAINLSSINANITAANAAISLLVTANINQGSYIELNTNRVAAANLEIGNLRANITAANAAIQVAAVAWVANAGVQQTQINGFNANITAANAAIAALTLSTTANAVAQNSLISALTANTGVLAANIDALFSNAAAQAVFINTITANIGAFQIYANANAVTQRTQIINLQENLNTTNGCVAALISANTTQGVLINTLLANTHAQQDELHAIENDVLELQLTFGGLGDADEVMQGNIANLQANTRQLASNIATLYANAATQLGQINTVNSNVIAQTSRVDDLYSNIAIRMADITTLFSNAATQNFSLNTLIANAATQHNELLAANANIGVVIGNVRSLQSNLAGFDDRITENGHLVDQLFERVEVLGPFVANLIPSATYANAAIDSVEGNLATATEEIYANIATRIQSINSIASDVSTLFGISSVNDDKFATTSANIGVLYNLLPVANANVRAANATIAALTVNVQVLESNVSFAQIDIASLQANLDNGNLVYTPNNAANWNGTISNVAAALDQLAARIRAIENL
jgi:chromosome segregation ATPase